MVQHIRVDEGVKRGKRIKPSEVENATRRQLQDQSTGKFLPAYLPEEREAAVSQALQAVEYGRETVEQVGERLNIPTSTLYSWLIGSAASAARTRFYDHLVARAAHEIRTAVSPLELTRAREEVAAWIKIAERRDHSAYGPKQEITHNVAPVLTINVAALPTLQRTIEELPLVGESSTVK